MNSHMALQCAVAAGFAVWVGLTALHNGPKSVSQFSNRLPLGRCAYLIPSWSFFAPRPADRDYALLMRDELAGGEMCPWKELGSSVDIWRLRRAFWNPEGRSKKALSDAASHLVRIAKDSPSRPQDLILSIPYLLLLNYACRFPAASNVIGRQFAIARHSRLSEDPQIIVVSNVHSLQRVD